jgi:hypothetical protein
MEERWWNSGKSFTRSFEIRYQKLGDGDVRYRAAYLQPRAFSRRQGSVAGDAEKGQGSCLFSNNYSSPRGRKRKTGPSR